MIDKNIIYNEEYLVILPIELYHLTNAFEYTYGNVFLFDNLERVDKQVNTIKKSHFNQIILVDFIPEYINIINDLNNTSVFKFIYTKALGTFSNESNYKKFNEIIRLYDKGVIKTIGFLDSNLYKVFKNKYNCCTLSLDIEKKEYKNKYNKKTVGLLNDPDNTMHSYYNELSALAFNNYKASLKYVDKEAKRFLKLFNIKYSVNKNKYLDNNLLNLYINFSDNNNILFLESMDRNVPCLLGNNDLINGTNLEKYLTMDSDDSIDEIKDKIELIKKNRDTILKEYKDFRDNYSKKCIKEKEDFLEYTEVEKKEEKHDLLLSILVPVYNTEKYLKKCLNSIIKALPRKLKSDCEIIIINDGSSDNSDLIIKEYENKYKYIKYIHQNNKGIGNVRNVFLKNAKGKYLAAIDSDDTINKKFFKDFMDSKDKDIDLFICDWLTKTDTTKYPTEAIENNEFKRISQYEGILYSSIMPSPCNKIIKRQLFDDLKIDFVEDKFEDLSTYPFVLMKAKKIIYNQKPYYEYYHSDNSIMRSYSGYSMINVIKELYVRFDKYKKYCNIDLEKYKYYTIAWRMEDYTFNQLINLGNKERESFIKTMYNTIYDEILETFQNKYYKELLDSLSKEKREYINNRNKAFKDKKLAGFKDNKEYMITSLTVYYGDKK